MWNVTGYRCSRCGEEYGLSEVEYVCPRDSGNLDVILDFGAIADAASPEDIHASGDRSMWRYLPLLPVRDPGYHGTPLRAVGWTPVYQPQKLAGDLDIQRLWLKDESSNPTASFKDRASALLVARAQEIGSDVVVTASTGNAGAALAGMAAAVGQKAVILAPKTAPPAKVAQLLVYGAQVFLVDGNYDAAVALAVEASNEFGWYCRNTGYNPYTAEGKKTAAFEIWEQVLATEALTKPLSIFVPVGDGNIISGIHKGFKDLQALGWLEEMPRIFGIQSQGSAAIANAFESATEDIAPVSAATLADSISVDLPSDGLRALRAATQTSGAYLKVSDEEILQAISELGRAGIFSEPAAAASYAGIVKARRSGLIEADDPILGMLTGSGLKDVKAAMQAAGDAPVIAPDLASLKEVIS